LSVLRDLWRGLLGRHSQPARPACRLSEDQALEIARAAIGAKPCFVQEVRQTEAGIEWLIGTATIGIGVTIRVSDATGEVLERRPWGVR
jgi:hypothetical protein